MPVLCVVGAGQLGSRHLQALARLPFPARLFVVDPSETARARAAERVAQIPGHERHMISWLASLAGVPGEVSLAIVATSARERLDVVVDLLNGRSVKFLILEKVLCQSVSQCQALCETVRQRGARAWVNGPRRLWPGFQSLRQALAEDRMLGFFAMGGGWGLACNAYHLLDLMAWFMGTASELRISPEFLDPDPIPSRRPGFLEVTGSLAGRFGDGLAFLITDVRGSSRPLELIFATDRRTFSIDNSTGALRGIAGESVEVGGGVLAGALQSELTTQVAADLLAQGECGLTPLEESAALHRPLLNALAAVLDSAPGGGGGVCPIT